MNPLFAPMLMLPVGTVVTQAMLIDDDEFLESRYYQEWVKPQGLRDMIEFEGAADRETHGLLGRQPSRVSPALRRC